MVLGKLLEGLLVMVVVEGEHVHLHRHPASILNNWTLVGLHTLNCTKKVSFFRNQVHIFILENSTLT